MAVDVQAFVTFRCDQPLGTKRHCRQATGIICVHPDVALAIARSHGWMFLDGNNVETIADTICPKCAKRWQKRNIREDNQ